MTPPFLNHNSNKKNLTMQSYAADQLVGVIVDCCVCNAKMPADKYPLAIYFKECVHCRLESPMCRSCARCSSWDCPECTRSNRPTK